MAGWLFHFHQRMGAGCYRRMGRERSGGPIPCPFTGEWFGGSTLANWQTSRQVKGNGKERKRGPLEEKRKLVQ